MLLRKEEEKEGDDDYDDEEERLYDFVSKHTNVEEGREETATTGKSAILSSLVMWHEFISVCQAPAYVDCRNCERRR